MSQPKQLGVSSEGADESYGSVSYVATGKRNQKLACQRIFPEQDAIPSRGIAHLLAK